ncbi:MAG TPA: rod shape-determining protein MreD, partial [Desulfuromonadales bacterium]|nr:rod shape-determining protein MreD [Desulfuromonadales bacterium]
MKRVLAYFAAGYLFMVLQTALLPRLLPFHVKPDLLLILVIYVGLSERCLRGAFLSYGLGYLNDVFAGHFAGLHGLALLIVFLAVRGGAGRVNTESSFLLLFMTGVGTLLEGAVMAFCLGFLADAGTS